jgi:hypothetical protein
MLALDLAAALDPDLFAREYLNFQPDPWQTKVLRWSGKRLLLNCCRQSGKSTITALLALHRAMFYSNSLILLVSSSQRQSSELYRKIIGFFGRLAEKPKTLEENSVCLKLENGSRIVTLPSKESTVRGYSSATLIIEDEAARVEDELYRSMRPMLAVSGGRLILMSTPHGMQGHFFEEWSSGDNAWVRIEIQATDCPRISNLFLDEERRRQGERWFRQEYCCEFAETADHAFSYQTVMKAFSPDVKTLFGGTKR